MKSEKTLKTTIFHWVTVSKPLGQNRIKRYLWKDNIHIFNLTPSGPIYPQYFCHTEPFYKQGPTKKWENGELSVHIFSRPWHNKLQTVINSTFSYPTRSFWKCIEPFWVPPFLFPCYIPASNCIGIWLRTYVYFTKLLSSKLTSFSYYGPCNVCAVYNSQQSCQI